jgi:hypothetical protein
MEYPVVSAGAVQTLPEHPLSVYSPVVVHVAVTSDGNWEAQQLLY